MGSQNNTLTHLPAQDGHKIPLRFWSVAPRKTVRGVIHISHGMAEHSLRYASTAQALTAAGYHVYAHDHRGHGENLAKGTAGYYADSQGWNKVVGDLGEVQRHIAKEHPGLPSFLLAHSMGSFISMGYLTTHNTNLSGLLLSGSNFDPVVRYHALRPILKAEMLRQGKKGRSPVVEFLTFGSFNKPYEPAPSKFEWLSRRKETITEYEQDTQCGFFSTNLLWEDLINGLIATYGNHGLARIPAHLPIYLFAGEKDPVGDMGKGVIRLTRQLIDTGHTDVTLKLYPEARHEMLNETNVDEVMSDIVSWLARKSGESTLKVAETKTVTSTTESRLAAAQ